jgi:hypothetical protein
MLPIIAAEVSRARASGISYHRDPLTIVLEGAFTNLKACRKTRITGTEKGPCIAIAIALMLCTAFNAFAAKSPFKHIVVIVQENRTPDNLFQGLCSPPYGSAQSCSTSPSSSQYNIQTSNWLNKYSPTGVTQPGPIPPSPGYDLNHDHPGFEAMCDRDSSGVCRVDGAANVSCTRGPCPANPQFKYIDNSTGILNPYLELATQ